MKKDPQTCESFFCLLFADLQDDILLLGFAPISLPLVLTHLLSFKPVFADTIHRRIRQFRYVYSVQNLKYKSKLQFSVLLVQMNFFINLQNQLIKSVL